MSAPGIVTLTQENFEQEVLKSPKPFLVDFTAAWCGPCKMLGPILDELAEEYDGRIRIGKVDVDAQQALAVKYGITGMPTLLLFQQGQVVQEMRGARGKKEIKASFDQVAAAA